MSEEGEAATEDGEASGKGGRSSKLPLILGLVGGLALGAGGMFVAVEFLLGEDETSGEDVAEEEVVEEEAPPLDILTVSMKRLNVPVINASGEVLGYMWIDATFEVIGPEAQSELSNLQARVKDGMIRRLYEGQTTRTDRPGALDFNRVEAVLLASAGEVIDPELIHRLNIANVQPAPR